MLGTPEIMIILLAVVLLIFGPKNLPKLGTAVGKTVRNVREGMEGTDEDEDSESPKISESSSDADAKE